MAQLAAAQSTHDHWVHHEVPGLNFLWNRPHPEQAQVFFFLYFVMTAVHAVHLTIGIGIISLILFQAVGAVVRSGTNAD